jgi:branched-chain amino acid transport system permease protein
MMDFLRQIINGLSIGSIYALVALGYTMVYGIVKLINFAHGDIIMVGSYVTFLSMDHLNMPFWVSILAAIVFCVILGVLMEILAYKPLRNAPKISALITAIGVSLFLQNVFMILFTPNPRSFPNVISGTVDFLNIRIGYATIITIIVAVGMMILLTLFVKNTKMGKAMRAVSEDAGAATLMGIDVNRTISITFAIGSALAAVGGVLYSSSYPLIQPTMGSLFGLKAFIAAVLGGIGIIPGAILGGFIIGLTESLTKGYISSGWSDAIVFSVLIIALLIKPSGILGKVIKEKV